jgi:hypothetical protein
LGEEAAAAMRAALKANPSPEMQRRLQGLLDEIKAPSSGAMLAALRAVAVLERIGSGDAQDLLKVLSEGNAESQLTKDAKGSLARLKVRPARLP